MKSTIHIYKLNLFLKVLLIATFLINILGANANNDTSKTSYYSKIQDSIFHTEKVYLHFDKPYYSSGEFIWFKTYLVSANTNKPDTKSKIVHVELIDPSNRIIKSRAIKIIDGGGEGEFYLPKGIISGEYTIRAYTNFMRNFDDAYFFRKQFKIGNEKSLANKKPKTTKNLKPDVQFFPEGGYMVHEQTSQVGFKVIGSDGKSINLSGAILDNNNNEILTFKTKNFGLGKFLLTPKSRKSYKAIIKYKGENYTYNLPKPLEKGVTMTVTERKDNFQIRLESSLLNGIDQLILVGLQNGKLVNMAQLIGSKTRATVNIPKNTLQQGIVQFTVIDKNQKPLCERLVFIETKNQNPVVEITPNKTDYGRRELVTLDLDINDLSETNASLAITDMSVVKPELNALDIKSYLLLKSELKGEIEQPGYYFNSKDKHRKKMLDILMMTQGWRQFLWNHDHKNKNEYDHEKGIYIEGIVSSKSHSKKPVAAEVSLIYMNKDLLEKEKLRSNKKGKFRFGSYNFNDSTSVIIQAKNYLTKRSKKNPEVRKTINNYNIKLTNYEPHAISKKNKYTNVKNQIDTTSVNNDYLAQSKKARLNVVVPFEDEFEKLDEVLLKHKRVKKEVKEKFKNRQTIYGKPTRRVDMDDIKSFGTNNILAALQGKIPGVRITGEVNTPMSWIDSGSGNSSSSGQPSKVSHGGNAQPNVRTNYSVVIRGSQNVGGQQKQALILLDNIPVQDFSGIIAANVSFVDVLTGASAAMYGSRAMGGVIAIHTKRGNENLTSKKERDGIINFMHPGYYKARKFYEPNYKIKKPEHKNLDYRTTIYWNPNLKLNSDSTSKITFYTADVETSYKIELQGISKDGEPLTKEAYINID